MTYQKIFERFIELFPNYISEVDKYKVNRMEKNSIVIYLKSHRKLIFTADKNIDSLQVFHTARTL